MFNEINKELAVWEQQVRTEIMAGNQLKEEYAKGRVAGLRTALEIYKTASEPVVESGRAKPCRFAETCADNYEGRCVLGDCYEPPAH